jgi:hypothetical protein
MKKIIITYGLIAGGIVSFLMVFSLSLIGKGIIDFDNGMFIGYATMVISFSMVFFGIKTYRDQHLGGTITFGKAIIIGILVTAIASVMYAITWEFYYNLWAQDFMQQYSDHYLQKLKREGASVAEIDAATKKLAESSEMYKNPVFRFAITLMEIFPVGVIIALVSAAFLRKKDVFPSSPAA